MWKLIFNLIMKRKFPGKTVESLTKRQLREVESEAIRTLNRTKGKKGDVFSFLQEVKIEFLSINNLHPLEKDMFLKS